MSYKVSAPGSLMLLGEYAVLHREPALVCAVDKRITVTLTPRVDKRIEIHSVLHGHYATDLSQLTIEKPFHFVLGALQRYQAKLKQGCDIEIVSAFSDKVGLGSSAAVTVAMLVALTTWLELEATLLDIVRLGRQVVRHVQGVGSGADVAASVYGGIVGYQAQPLSVEKFSVLYPLTALYAGVKTPTVEAIKYVQDYFVTRQDLFRHLIHAIGQCAVLGRQSVRVDDAAKLGEMMNIQQGLMESLGVCTPLLRGMVDNLREQPGMWGAKISGAGWGDCVIGMGVEIPTFSKVADGVQCIPVAMTLKGVQGEKI